VAGLSGGDMPRVFGSGNSFFMYLAAAEQLTPLWHLKRNDPTARRARRRKNKAKVTKHKTPANVNASQSSAVIQPTRCPLSKPVIKQAQLIEKCTVPFPFPPYLFNSFAKKLTWV